MDLGLHCYNCREIIPRDEPLVFAWDKKHNCRLSFCFQCWTKWGDKHSEETSKWHAEED